MKIESDLKNTLFIWDVDDPVSTHLEAPQNHDLLWRGFNSSNEKNSFSILKIVEDNAFVYREQYLKLIYDLGELKINDTNVVEYLEMPEGISYWWMTLFSEKCNYVKSPEIVNSIKLMALHSFLEDSNYTHIIFISKNRLVADSMNLLTESLGIKFNFKSEKEKNPKRINISNIYKKLPFMIQSFVWLSFHLYKRWILKGVGLREWKKTKAKYTFVSYLTDNTSLEAKNLQFESKFWIKLPKVLRDNKIDTNWLHLWLEDRFIPNATDAKNFLNKFNQNDLTLQTHVTLHTFLNINLIIYTINNFFKLRKLGLQLAKHIENKSHYHWPILKNDFNQSFFGSNAISNLLYLSLFDRAMSLLPIQSKGFYLQENQGWEFAFVHAWKSKGHGEEFFGCPHTNVRFWDLRYFFYKSTYYQKSKFKIPLPDYTALNGNYATKIYLEGDYDRNRLVEVEALRYLFLDDGFINFEDGQKKEINEYKVLILGDAEKEPCSEQLNLLSLAQSYIDIDIKYIYKPHPNYIINLKDYPNLDLTVIQDNISTILDDFSIVFSSSNTSACVDAYCKGLEVCIVLDTNNVNLSPLRGFEEVFFVSTPQELANKFNIFFGKPFIKKMQNDYYFLDSNIPKWKELLFR
jgi:surface carbohydrate biosynthesis protein (TIGR04326 family)